jgi:hypothetical protein
MTDPIGKVLVDEAVVGYVDAVKTTWTENKEVIPWWKFWKRHDLATALAFMLNCIDELVFLAEISGIIVLGPDKKATVIDSVGKLFDHIVAPILPVWLKPATSMIRKFILNIVLAAAIDWMIMKYNTGSWNQKTPEEIKAQYQQIKAQMFGVPGGHRPK